MFLYNTVWGVGASCNNLVVCGVDCAH